jgi:alpha-mannosidase
VSDETKEELKHMKKKVEKIVVVFKTHFDIGFTKLASEVIDNYGKKMLPDVVKTCNATQEFPEHHRFTWTMSAWPLVQSLLPQNAEKETIAQAKSLINQGQICWHALPFTTHTEFCGLEEFIRGFNQSGKLSEEFGRWPISAKMTDVPGHTWILPTLLSKAGIKFLHLGCNPFSTSPDVPQFFYWEGPDGSRILTFYNKGQYGSALTPPEDWPFPVWLALMQTGDNHGPQEPKVIERILAEIGEKLPDTEVVFGSLDDFVNELGNQELDLPIIRGDLADTWIHGIGTYPREVSRIRALRHELVGIEKALAMGKANQLFVDSDTQAYKDSIDGAFERCLLFSEHTWGLDVKKWMGDSRHYEKKLFLQNKNTPLYERMEQSWDEQRDRVYHAEAMLDKTSNDLLKQYAEAIEIDGSRFVVFNGLGWERSAWTSLKKFSSQFQDKQLVDAETGESVQVRYMDNVPYAYMKNVPSLGYKTIRIVEGTQPTVAASGIKVSAAEGLLENEWYKLKIDAGKGVIVSLVEKATDHEWVDSKQTHGFGQYQYDVYGDEDLTEFIRSYAYRFYNWGVDDFGRRNYPTQQHLVFEPQHFTIQTESGPGYAKLILKARINDESLKQYGNITGITTKITMYDDQPYIDLAYDLEGKEETSFVEAGHFIFPIQLNNPQVAINKLGSVVDPQEDIVRNANHTLHCCEHWVDVSDGDKGMAIIPLDTPLVSIGSKGILQFRREPQEKSSTLFFNAFNNGWGTNFPQWMGGDYSFSYRLIPHQGNWQQANIAEQAFETVTPLQIGFASVKADNNKSVPVSSEWMNVSEGMQIVCLKPAEKGEGLILRLREINGMEKKVTVTFKDPYDSIEACDLLERAQEVKGINTKQLSFHTKPFEVHSFYLREQLE